MSKSSIEVRAEYFEDSCLAAWAEIEKLTAENKLKDKQIESLQARNEKLRAPLGRDIELLEDNDRLTAEGRIMLAALKQISGAKHMTADKGDELTKAINHDAMVIYADEAIESVSGRQT